MASLKNDHLIPNEDFFSIFIIFKLVTCFIDSLTFGMKAHSIAYLRSESEHIYWILNQWSGKTDS